MLFKILNDKDYSYANAIQNRVNQLTELAWRTFDEKKECHDWEWRSPLHDYTVLGAGVSQERPCFRVLWWSDKFKSRRENPLDQMYGKLNGEYFRIEFGDKIFAIVLSSICYLFFGERECGLCIDRLSIDTETTFVLKDIGWHIISTHESPARPVCKSDAQDIITFLDKLITAIET